MPQEDLFRDGIDVVYTYDTPNGVTGGCPQLSLGPLRETTGLPSPDTQRAQTLTGSEA